MYIAPPEGRSSHGGSWHLLPQVETARGLRGPTAPSGAGDLRGPNAPGGAGDLRGPNAPSGAGVVHDSKWWIQPQGLTAVIGSPNQAVDGSGSSTLSGQMRASTAEADPGRANKKP